MRHVTLLEELEAYRPWNDQEERDRAELLRRLRSGEALYTRDNAAGHLTASAWVVSPDRTQVLMAYHNLYDSWSWLGGHADGDRDLLAVSMREVRVRADSRRCVRYRPTFTLWKSSLWTATRSGAPTSLPTCI